MAPRARRVTTDARISNPQKVLYPAAKFSKADVVDYYRSVPPFLLPHFRNRPVTLKRYPDGVHGDAFYEKDAPGFTPEWVKTFPVPRREGGPDINYILINNVATLTWAANMAALELHPFLHRVPKIENPTHVVFDLDPGEGANIFNCAEVAFLLRDALAKLRLRAFAKVSGSKGIQVYVPLNTDATIKHDIRAHPILYVNVVDIAKQRKAMAHEFLAVTVSMGDLAGEAAQRVSERQLSSWVRELELAFQQYVMLKEMGTLYQDYGYKPQNPGDDGRFYVPAKKKGSTDR